MNKDKSLFCKFTHGFPYARLCIVCCVQGSASECVLVSMLAARHAALDELKIQYPGVEDGVLLARMVAYCSKLVRTIHEQW